MATPDSDLPVSAPLVESEFQIQDSLDAQLDHSDGVESEHISEVADDDAIDDTTTAVDGEVEDPAAAEPAAIPTGEVVPAYVLLYAEDLKALSRMSAFEVYARRYGGQKGKLYEDPRAPSLFQTESRITLPSHALTFDDDTVYIHRTPTKFRSLVRKLKEKVRKVTKHNPNKEIDYEALNHDIGLLHLDYDVRCIIYNMLLSSYTMEIDVEITKNKLRGYLTALSLSCKFLRAEIKHWYRHNNYWLIEAPCFQLGPFDPRITYFHLLWPTTVSSPAWFTKLSLYTKPSVLLSLHHIQNVVVEAQYHLSGEFAVVVPFCRVLRCYTGVRNMEFIIHVRKEALGEQPRPTLPSLNLMFAHVLDRVFDHGPWCVTTCGCCALPRIRARFNFYGRVEFTATAVIKRGASVGTSRVLEVKVHAADPDKYREEFRNTIRSLQARVGDFADLSAEMQ